MYQYHTGLRFVGFWGLLSGVPVQRVQKGEGQFTYDNGLLRWVLEISTRFRRWNGVLESRKGAERLA